MRLKRAIDSLPEDDREAISHRENRSYVQKFIRSSRLELELRVGNQQPRKICEAFNIAELTNRQLREDELHR